MLKDYQLVAGVLKCQEYRERSMIDSIRGVVFRIVVRKLHNHGFAVNEP